MSILLHKYDEILGTSSGSGTIALVALAVFSSNTGLLNFVTFTVNIASVSANLSLLVLGPKPIRRKKFVSNQSKAQHAIL